MPRWQKSRVACAAVGYQTLTPRLAATATGGSAIKAVEVLIDHGVPQERIIFLNLVSCPEGLRAMYAAYPQVKVVTAWVDDGLDSHKYIVPGLGGESVLDKLGRSKIRQD